MKQRSLSLFPGARKINIHGSSFVVNNNNPTCTSSERPQNDAYAATFGTAGRLNQLLREETAPNAILNAEGRADVVRCYPGTREEVIGKIEKWMDSEALPGTSRMMWLSGPAGAGKSAIMQTVAERCEEHGRHAANFFFFRGDGTRNHAKPLVATLVYQLRALYPALDQIMEDCLTATPLIHRASIGEQFKKLISAPIHTVRHSSESSTHQPIILIMDGLDECNDKTKQEQILVALHALIEGPHSPFLVLVASRTEPQIVMSFNNIATSVVSIFLDDEYRPEDDIRRFVIAKFNEIRRAHHLAHTLEEQWPSGADVDAIVHKSSGQFVYAATVMRFIQYSSASPALSLLTVRGIRPAGDHSPYAQLDAIYTHILSNSRNFQAVKLCLALHFIMIRRTEHRFDDRPEFKSLVDFAGYKQIELESLFADLAPIVSVQTSPRLRLAFYHASMPDYLMDDARSGVYYVDVDTVALQFCATCLVKNTDVYTWLLGVSVLICVNKENAALSQCVSDASKVQLQIRDSWVLDQATDYGWRRLVEEIYYLYFESDRALFKFMLRHWIRFAYINNISRTMNTSHLMNINGPTKYYNWYLVTEGLKYALRLHKLHSTN